MRRQRSTGVLGSDGLSTVVRGLLLRLLRSVVRRSSGVERLLVWVIGGVLLLERDALLRNGVVVGLNLRLLDHDGGGGTGLEGTAVEALLAVLVDDYGIGDDADEEEKPVSMC